MHKNLSNVFGNGLVFSLEYYAQNLLWLLSNFVCVIFENLHVYQICMCWFISKQREVFPFPIFECYHSEGRYCPSSVFNVIHRAEGMNNRKAVWSWSQKYYIQSQIKYCRNIYIYTIECKWYFRNDVL